MKPLWTSFAHAFAGIAYATRTQRNMRLHLAAAIVALTASVVLQVPRPLVVSIVLVVAVVLAVELLNTALEAVVDLMTAVHHPLAKAAKDSAAGAVLVVACAAVAVAALTFLGNPERTGALPAGDGGLGTLGADAPCGRSLMCYNGAGLNTDPSSTGDGRSAAASPARQGSDRRPAR
jgi:diacylglycerol kinase